MPPVTPGRSHRSPLVTARFHRRSATELGGPDARDGKGRENMDRIGEVFPVRSLLATAMQVALVLCVVSRISLAQMPGQKMPGLEPTVVEQTSYGMHATAGRESLDVTVCADSVIHVVARPEKAEHEVQQPWMLDAQQSCPGVPFTFAQDTKTASLKTAQLEVIVNLERGNLSFRSAAGEPLLNEGSSIPRTYEPVDLNGERTFPHHGSLLSRAAEALYGLGQHQSGMFNYRGSTVELGQNNTDVAIPLLVSSKGYALLWNTASLTMSTIAFRSNWIHSMAGKSDRLLLHLRPGDRQIIHEYRTMTGHAPMLPSGPMVSSSPRTAMYPRTKYSISRTVIARSTFPWTRLCRTGSGGRTEGRSDLQLQLSRCYGGS